jgi:hypothetical protein
MIPPSSKQTVIPPKKLSEKDIKKVFRIPNLEYREAAMKQANPPANPST